jgi:hypothetical protein
VRQETLAKCEELVKKVCGCAPAWRPSCVESKKKLKQTKDKPGDEQACVDAVEKRAGEVCKGK